MLGLAGLVGNAAAVDPRLSSLSPGGVQIGTETEVIFRGQRLADAEDIFFYHPGVELVKITEKNDKFVKALIKADGSCPLGEHKARDTPCPKPAECPAVRRCAGPAPPHRLRSARSATRRPGGVGLSCWAIACGGGPPPKACKSCTGCACASGCGATMALWHGSVATDRRPARRPPSVKYVSHRNGAAASPPDTRTARRGPHAGAPAREGALLVCFTRG